MLDGRLLDSAPSRSYLAAIPFHRSPGGAFVRASVFRLETGLTSDEMGGDCRGFL